MNPKAKFRFFATWLVLLIFSIFPAFASATVSISAHVDKTHLTLDDTLELSVRINGTTQAGGPQLPPLPDFDVQSTGSSSSIKIINGIQSATVTHRYLLLPKKEGTFVIGSVRLDLNGKHYEAPEITVTVVPPSVGLPDKESAIFVEAEVSNETPYLQEQIILTYRLYRKIEIRNATLDAPLEHFRKVELGDPLETSRIINGIRYYISEARYSLFPMQEGILRIPSAMFQLDVVKRDSHERSPFSRFHLPDPLFNDPFFSGGIKLERKRIRTQPIEIKVRPFPAKGKPPGFTPLTGPLTMQSELNPMDLSVGETATWTITLKGRSNMNELRLTPPEGTVNLKVYTDQPTTDETPSGGFLEGKKTFKFALVPTHPGKLSLEKVRLHYFDPEKMVFRTLSTDPLDLTIKPGAKVPSSQDENNLSKRVNTGNNPVQGLLPIHTQPGLLSNGVQVLKHPGIFLTALLLPPIGFILFRNFYIKRARMKLDIVFARRQTALSKALSKLNRIESSSPLDPQKQAREVSLVFREYLGDRFNFQGTALTPEEMEAKLCLVQLDPNKIKTILELLEYCQEIEYAPVTGANEMNLFKESTRLIEELEKE